MSDPIPSANAAAESEKRRVALSSVVAAVFLTALKLVVGLSTGSLGILSEAAHSLFDLVAAVVTFWAVRVSGKPADREHTYGHGKYENLSALFETLLLLVTCVWIIYESIQRLFFHDVHVDASPWAFAILGISIVVDVSRSRALKRVAQKYGSQALEADALHFSTDIASSAVVLGGLFFVLLSEKLGVAWLAKADVLAALVVAGIVIWISVQLGKKSIDDLLDAVPAGIQERVDRAARVAGVLEVRQVRIRRSGPETFADVTLTVSSESALERAHAIATEAESAIRAEVVGADVVVHVEPSESGDAGLLSSVRRQAMQLGLGAHGVRVYHQGGRRSVELHLEVEESLTLREAHAQATRFEAALRRAVPELDQVVSHIEPRGDASAHRLAAPDDEAPVRAALMQVMGEAGAGCQPHALCVQRVGGELSVSFHCAMDAETSIADAHELTERVEKGLRTRLPNLGRVVIHVEPPEGDDAAAGAEPPAGQEEALKSA